VKLSPTKIIKVVFHSTLKAGARCVQVFSLFSTLSRPFSIWFAGFHTHTSYIYENTTCRIYFVRLEIWEHSAAAINHLKRQHTFCVATDNLENIKKRLFALCSPNMYIKKVIRGFGQSNKITTEHMWNYSKHGDERKNLIPCFGL